ncbi:type II toxin-antitoxin system PemK/MazF family toxin [Microbacterium radiodurans]|uniref:Type II toxin-antitoxin system PemK/MazF family toxin n=1 Tax=Microbacterium radiodurans TaxID=661398 RepID=A0A5J5IT53_9MICO|nr:type II toxin-antitoxin system PemK/MazF family toxin [Microbacterium radiodurans]KAA9087028.1 type II toxin-antitoxin system PemK/MazF family toxin [Microbacterium radiodurans]
MGVLSRVWDLLRPRRSSPSPGTVRVPSPSPRAGGTAPRRTDAASVVEVALPPAGGLSLAYRPRPDVLPDPGEVVWARVPYAEDPSQGKDRPLLVLARADAESSWAMKLTSRPHAGHRDHLPLGAGEWDREGRPSWLDVDQIYLVPAGAIRRTAGAVDRSVYLRVAGQLAQRYGWRVAGR